MFFFLCPYPKVPSERALWSFYSHGLFPETNFEIFPFSQKRAEKKCNVKMGTKTAIPSIGGIDYRYFFLISKLEKFTKYTHLYYINANIFFRSNCIWVLRYLIHEREVIFDFKPYQYFNYTHKTLENRESRFFSFI